MGEEFPSSLKRKSHVAPPDFSRDVRTLAGMLLALLNSFTHLIYLLGLCLCRFIEESIRKKDLAYPGNLKFSEEAVRNFVNLIFYSPRYGNQQN